jgi:hypothetical protein
MEPGYDGELKAESVPDDAVAVEKAEINPGISKVHEELQERAGSVGGAAAPFSGDGVNEKAYQDAVSSFGAADVSDEELFEDMTAADRMDTLETEVRNFEGDDPNAMGPLPETNDSWNRLQSMQLAARIHQGRGISIVDVIDDAKMIEAYIEHGEVPDFSA